MLLQKVYKSVNEEVFSRDDDEVGKLTRSLTLQPQCCESQRVLLSDSQPEACDFEQEFLTHDDQRTPSYSRNSKQSDEEKDRDKDKAKLKISAVWSDENLEKQGEEMDLYCMEKKDEHAADWQKESSPPRNYLPWDEDASPDVKEARCLSADKKEQCDDQENVKQKTVAMPKFEAILSSSVKASFVQAESVEDDFSSRSLENGEIKECSQAEISDIKEACVENDERTPANQEVHTESQAKVTVHNDNVSTSKNIKESHFNTTMHETSQFEEAANAKTSFEQVEEIASSSRDELGFDATQETDEKKKEEDLLNAIIADVDAALSVDMSPNQSNLQKDHFLMNNDNEKDLPLAPLEAAAKSESTLPAACDFKHTQGRRRQSKVDQQDSSNNRVVRQSSKASSTKDNSKISSSEGKVDSNLEADARGCSQSSLEKKSVVKREGSKVSSNGASVPKPPFSPSKVNAGIPSNEKNIHSTPRTAKQRRQEEARQLAKQTKQQAKLEQQSMLANNQRKVQCARGCFNGTQKQWLFSNGKFYLITRTFNINGRFLGAIKKEVPSKKVPKKIKDTFQ